ncbi:MAG TPA: DNA polymerase domain-containing protein, partial [Spirochaetia bacterium]|nr:DNA polymerase domain-containing protein [Spirochaetia bacterium]
MPEPAPDRGFILQSSERTHAGRTEIHLVGRLESGETFAVVERRLTPCFFVRASDAERAGTVLAADGSGTSPSPTDRCTMDGEPVLRVESPTVSGSQRQRDALHREGIRTYEADIKPSTQLLMDRRIHGAVAIDGPWRPGRRVGRIYENPVLTPCEIDPPLTVASLDIETDARAATVYAVGLYRLDLRTGATTSDMLLNGEPGVSVPTALTFPTERALLAGLRERLIELDPDIITGWNVIDFDFRVLARRFSALGVPFDIGRAESPATFLDREDTDGVTRWRRNKAIVPGRQVLDGLWLVRTAGMGLEDYRLETVAQTVLGRGKRIEELPGESRTEAIERLYRRETQKLCDYCAEDTRLALDILLKEGLLDIAVRKSQLIGISLEQTSVSVAAFEFLYTEHLHQRAMVAPTLGIDQDTLERAPGGGIITPRAGLFRNVLTFDFKSLYPSLMRTFNIDPLTRLRAGAAGAAGTDSGSTAPVRAPNGASFGREPGILPGILDRFFESREAARQRGDTRATYAYKIVMNSFYGVLGTSGCRFAASALAGAITSFGQHILYWARDLVGSLGYDVIYGDTDSLFVLSGAAAEASGEELARRGAELSATINDKLRAYARSSYDVESRLEIEFEAVYARFFLPPMRTAAVDTDEETETRGRAKGYAGLRVSPARDGAPASAQLEVVGMEAVRHDWTPLAQQLQRTVLDRVFHDAPAAEIE